MAKRTHTKADLEAALSDLYYVALQCATYHYWFLVVKPVANKDAKIAADEFCKLIDNGVIEITLLFIRKTTEFFKEKEKRDKSDTIYSYLYGYSAQELIVDSTTYGELHKRVGHITFMQAWDGQKSWQIIGFVRAAINKWADFFDFLAKSESAINPKYRDKCSKNRDTLIGILEEIHAKVRDIDAGTT